MSARAVTWAVQQKIASRTLSVALVTIASRCDHAGVTVASQATLAEDLGVTVRQIKRHLAALEWLGIIARTARSNGARGRATDMIRLSLEASFNICRGDIPARPTSARKVTKTSCSERSQGDITPHLAQGDKNVTAIREYISKGGAKPKSCQSYQGVSATRHRAKTGDECASAEGVPQSSKLLPPGTKSARHSKGSVYARHRASLDRLTRGTLH